MPSEEHNVMIPGQKVTLMTLNFGMIWLPPINRLHPMLPIFICEVQIQFHSSKSQKCTNALKIKNFLKKYISNYKTLGNFINVELFLCVHVCVSMCVCVFLAGSLSTIWFFEVLWEEGQVLII